MTDQAPPKVKRSKDDLHRHLGEQMEFLRRSAAAYDQGFEGEAKRLATVIRVLLYDTKGSKSLLGQLRLKELLRFEDTALEKFPGNLLPTNGLTLVKGTRDEAGGLTVQYAAPLGELSADRLHSPKAFDQWWTKPVTEDNAGNRFSRRKLVLTAANQYGGAHVDPGLDDAYEALSRRNSMGWMVKAPSGDEMPLNDVALASIRQIAFELDKTLVRDLPHLVNPPPA